MARDFVSASSERLVMSGAPISPLSDHTMAIWAYVTSDPGVSQSYMSIGDSSDSEGFSSLHARWGAASNPMAAFYSTDGGGTNVLANSTAGPSLNTWFHFAATFDFGGGNCTGKTYLDGGNSASDTQAEGTTTALDQLTIGGSADSTITYSDASLCHAACWNIVLDDEQVSALAAGAHPFLIAPHALVFYSPLNNASEGSETDLISGGTLSEDSTPTFSDSIVLGNSHHGGLVNVGGFSARRRDIINLLTGDRDGDTQPWNATKALIPASALVRTSDSEATLDLGEFATAGYDCDDTETISLSNITEGLWKLKGQ